LVIPDIRYVQQKSAKKKPKQLSASPVLRIEIPQWTIRGGLSVKGALLTIPISVLIVWRIGIPM
jgi:hypothetical protein